MTGIPIKRFYMIRHGETIANARGIVSGAMDTPLTEKGRGQAAAARSIVETLHERPALIVHSNLSRAKDTAQIINEKLNIPMQEIADVAERNFGDWAGIPVKEWRHRHQDGLEPPGGETTEQFADRVFRGMSRIMNLAPEPVLIVSHAGVFRVFLSLYGRKIDLLGNCHLYEFSPETWGSFPWAMRRYSPTEK